MRCHNLHPLIHAHIHLHLISGSVCSRPLFVTLPESMLLSLMLRRIVAPMFYASLSSYISHLMNHTMLSALVVGMCIGLAAHHLVFIKGEWHTHSPTIIFCHGLAFLCLSLSTILEHAIVTSDVLSLLTPIFNGYLAGLATSISIYRCFFHRLTKANFPGPWYSKLSTMWSVWASRHRKYYLTLHALHEKYGDFVRTGKNTSLMKSYLDMLHFPSSLH